jgi:transposase InsO family protein
MEKLCRLFGHSRQAYYQNQKYDHQQSLNEEIILEMVRDKRKLMSRIGARKLLEMIIPGLQRQGLEVGRDAFFDLLRGHGLLIRRRRRRVITTYSRHWLKKYPNLIKDLVIDRPNQVWVSDITYIETDQGFMYLFLITDAYSRKILGYYLSEDLKTSGAIKALEMAIANSLYSLHELIHHSDRGIQYCSGDYVELLQKNHVQISMTAKGDPLENAIAERVNGILKDEWIHHTHYATKTQARLHLDEIIPIYNNIRPHLSCDMLTPEKTYLTSGVLKKRWKTYSRKKSTMQLQEIKS